MDLNEFPPIFQKVQHSHSRHHKITSNFLRIMLKGILKFNEIWPLEGAMYITVWWNFRGHPENVDGFKKLMVSNKEIHRAYRTHATHIKIKKKP